MVFNEAVRKYILIGFVVLIAGGLITAKIMAKKQDEQFAYEDALYQQATQLYGEEKYEEALAYVDELLKTQADSEATNYLGALTAMVNEQYPRAATLMQKTLDINPHKVEDAMFMLQFAEMLYFAERYEDAEVVLVKCRDMAWAPEEFPEYQNYVNELLTNIEMMQAATEVEAETTTPDTTESAE